MGCQPQHGHELLACLFRGHERVDPRGQRFAEFGRAERPTVHQDDRSAARRRGVQLASTGVDQGQCGRTRVPRLPVGVGRWRQRSLQDEWHLVGDNGAHHPVERRTRAGRDQGQHRAAAARCRRGVLRRWRRGIEHAEHGCPGDGVRAAAHVQLVVDPALEVLHGERAEPQQLGDLRDAVPGSQQDDELHLSIGKARPARPAVVPPSAPQHREHRTEAVRFWDERRHARPAGSGQVPLRSVPVSNDHVQLREPLRQALGPDRDLMQPPPCVQDHGVGLAQLAERDDVIRLRDLPDHGNVRVAGQERGQRVAQEAVR